MTKRASGKFKRRAQDAYDTPPEAVLPLLPHLPRHCWYAEPCCGNMSLVDALEAAGHRCFYKADILTGKNALTTDVGLAADYIITNPPWTREILHPMIEHFRKMRPTWLLFDADWSHTKQAIPHLKYCHKIVSVGRISWMQNGQAGFDNCAWHFFRDTPAETVFIGRVA